MCCPRSGVLNGRGLVGACYARWTRAGRIHEFPPQRNQTRDTLLDKWQRLARNPPLGLRMVEAARTLDITPGALRRALARARRDGDPRALYLPHGRTGVVYDPDRYRQLGDFPRKGGRS